MPAIIVDGDLLQSNAKFIVHQCNCVSWNAAHLARNIFYVFPYTDVYLTRKLDQHRDSPGEIAICGNGIDKRYVVAIFGQIYPGRPRATVPEDDYVHRTGYFFNGLKKIAALPSLQSVAFPWQIGCGAAGNNWEKYHSLIDKFADHVNDKAEVYIYKLPSM